MQEQLAGVDAAHAHLAIGRPDLDAVPPALDDEGGDRVVVARDVASSVLANTVYQSACTTPDIQHFVPLRIQSSPSATALVRMPMTSLPAWGSESPKPLRWEPSAMPGRYFCFCSSEPAIITGPVGSRVSSSMRAAVLEYLATSSMAMVSPRMPAPLPP